MLNKSFVVLPLVSMVSVLTACSSGGSHSRIDKILDVPLASKTLDTNGLVTNAKSDNNGVPWIVKNQLNGNDKEFDIEDYEITIDNKTYKKGDKIDLKDLGANPGIAPTVTITDIQENFNVIDKNGKKLGNIETNRKAYLYQQQHSIIGSLGSISHKVNGEDFNFASCDKNCDTPLFMGESTKNLPNAGRANYKGVAWTTKTNGEAPYTLGSLDYTVDFEAKNGSGNIKFSGKDNDIRLESSKIEALSGQNKNALDGSAMPGHGISGKAIQGDSKGQYDLRFFGPSAEEVAGYVDIEGTDKNVDVGFSGVKDAK
ncbi:Slam-dependent surface lipoprotein [Psychrobacter sp. FDAARGOS_221]|uniref:Slam-dependent surface lipoprotein n=1 Tax=Psychrobacter sp. FDAARGOS_221 TaxID=1975705 RepID=UPI000BB58CC9|nr:Slam-dependent surface lipoprotein [Psychrobacter sp. FDAARGOS_221]PNK60665.1 hypothetical protein A6J60_007120 [Psychrobacter sp. FDAARGOS_221]